VNLKEVRSSEGDNLGSWKAQLKNGEPSVTVEGKTGQSEERIGERARLSSATPEGGEKTVRGWANDVTGGNNQDVPGGTSSRKGGPFRKGGAKKHHFGGQHGDGSGGRYEKATHFIMLSSPGRATTKKERRDHRIYKRASGQELS